MRERLEPLDAWLPRAQALARELMVGPQPFAFDVQSAFRLLPPDRPSGEAAIRLAESLPRTPDRANRAALLRDRVALLRPAGLATLGEPIANGAIRLVAGHFVFAPNIAAALARAAREGGVYSFDMLGEGARTAADAARNFALYAGAIEAIAGNPAARGKHGISVKLSSIHERYDAAGYAQSRRLLLERLGQLCQAASAAEIQLTIDAEESERLPLHLDLLAALGDGSGIGIVLQAYHRDILDTVERVIAIAKTRKSPLYVRLVKGAYWDSEVGRAQQLGLPAYPVFTDKRKTDLAYAAAARRLLDAGEAIRPQFATHNPVTLACVLAFAGDRPAEIQRLHGMGAGAQRALARIAPRCAVRTYAPVGPQADLLPYLVRRLLENGASTSYVRQAALVKDPRALLARGFEFLSDLPETRLPIPTELHMPERRVATGYDLGHPDALSAFARQVARLDGPWNAFPLISGRHCEGPARRVVSPSDASCVIGEVVDATPEQARDAIGRAHAAHPAWAGAGVEARAAVLDRLAERLEGNLPNLVALCAREAGKTLADGVADIREAVDFCRYYAQQARVTFGEPLALRSPSGERNELSLHGRGVFACISPWNFPVAIFTGQVVAALVAGNTVVAKPAEQTPLTAFRIAELLLASGIPADAFHLLTGGAGIGRALVADPRIAGVAFTGSNVTARAIARSLAERDGPVVPLIAETGGLNAMIVDSTALPEQVVDAVVASAFRSAGQRCSSLRMLYVQDEIAARVIGLLQGALAALRLGDPADPATDVGPVIDAEAKRGLQSYVDELRGRSRFIGESASGPAKGHFIAPCAFEVRSIADLPGERFGPILHVARFAIHDLDRVIDDINATGYGLTMGVHSRIDGRVEHIRRRARVGNLYVNRNMIGAVVGVQPFGGEGLSGTGPKAGGPNYLGRFATERTFTVNTAAAGGDLRLMTRAV